MQQENNIISKKKIIRIHIICLSVVAVILLAAYIGITVYYTNHFAYNTWINGYYCTGLTAEEALLLMSSDDVLPSVTVEDSEGNIYELDMSKVEFSYDYGTTVNELLTAQTPYEWPTYIKNARVYNITPDFTINKDDLKKTFEKLDFIKEEIKRKPEYILYYSEEEGKYSYINNLDHRLDYETAFEDLYKAVLRGDNKLIIDEINYYINYEPDKVQQKTMDRFNRIDTYQNCDLIYDMGDEKILFTPELALSFLVLDESGLPREVQGGNFELDEEKVIEWVTNLCEEYDTFEKPRSFTTHSGTVTEIAGGTYGTILNQETEIAFLIDNLLASGLHDGIADSHIPEYLVTAYSRGKNDIGGTFVEVDIINQHLYYYENYDVIMESDIVSGNEITGHNTILGIYSLIAKEEGRYLMGVDYTAFANYWMPFYKNFGLNDSTWLEEYGGDIYKTHGSHGTINMPLEFAQQLYEKIEPGVPIVIYKCE